MKTENFEKKMFWRAHSVVERRCAGRVQPHVVDQVTRHVYSHVERAVDPGFLSCWMAQRRMGGEEGQ